MNHRYGSGRQNPVAKVDHVKEDDPDCSTKHPDDLCSDEESEYEIVPIRRIYRDQNQRRPRQSTMDIGLTPPDISAEDTGAIRQTTHIEPTQRPSIVSIEGIPGSGKSTVLELLSERFKDTPDVVVLREPSSIWNDIKAEGLNLIDLYFKDQNRYGFVFQLVYFMAIERQLQRAIKTHSDKRVIICERSLLSARVVYNEMLPKENRIKYDIYQTLFQKEGVGNVYPDHIILLDTEPRECLGKTSRKDWRGEEIITLEYLQRCRRHHLEMKRRHSGGWTTINGKRDQIINEVGTIVRAVVDMLQTVATNDQHQIPEKVKIVSLEGNIGAGKSTLLSKVEQRCKDRGITDIRILREPVEEWEKVTDGTKTILQLFYENPAEYGFPLQILVGITTMNRIHRELLNYPDTRIILSERSILSSREVFARMLRQDGFLDDVEDRVYHMLFEGNGQKALTHPEMMMYIDTDPITCLSRVGRRDRKGENRITLEELQKCESYHKTMFRETSIHVRAIETDLEVEGKKVDWVDTMIRWCQQLENGKEPNQLTSPIKENLGERDWWIDWDGSETEEEHEQSGSICNMEFEDLIEPIRRIKESQNNDQEELCLVKLRYGSLIYRFALPDWKLTNNRVNEEIKEAWPELEDKDIILSWKLIEKDSNGRCEDQDLNESLDYIELIDGKEVNRIMECEIKLPYGPAECTYPSNDITCSGTGDTQL